ncbi:unnamed protein product [Caenorhabditis nigoni]
MGSYRYLLMMLPVIGFIFAFCEFMTDPFFHSYNGGFAFFRLSSFENVSSFLNLCALGCYVAFYGSTISVLTLQFVYRSFPEKRFQVGTVGSMMGLPKEVLHGPSDHKSGLKTQSLRNSKTPWQ